MVTYFILNSVELGELILQDDPLGWDTMDKSLIRDNNLLGIMRKQSAELRFHGDGQEYLDELYALKLTEGIVSITIKRKVDYEDRLENIFTGIAKLNPYKQEYEGEKKYIKLEFEDSEFHNKILTRDDQEINTGLNESIDGVALGSFPTQQIKIKQRDIVEQNTFIMNEVLHDFAGNFGGPIPPEYATSDGGFVLPIQIVEGETESIKTPSDYQPDGGSESAIYPISPQGAAIKLAFNVQFLAASLGVGYLVLRIYTNTYDSYVDTIIETLTTSSYPTQEPWDIDYTNNFSLAPNQGFSIFFIYGSSYTANVTSVELSIEVIKFFEELTTDCHYRFDYVKRLIQIITGQEDCLKSSVFDVGGKYRDHVVMSGLQIRGFDSPPVNTLKNTLQSIKAVWGVYFGIEKINGIYKAVLEELPYFFRGDISVTLYGCKNVNRYSIDQFTFSDVHAGFKKAEYEEVNGLEEFNNLCRFSTYIKSIKGILDLISDERGDITGMEYARRKHKTYAASEDTRYDNDVFIRTVIGESGILVSKKDEGYDSVQNILSPETIGNLDITPQRNLLRNGDLLRACLEKYPTEYVKFLSADKESDLITTKTGEDPVSEQTDILNSSLLSPIFLNLKDEFECELTQADMKAMERKPYSLVKWSPYSKELTTKFYYGWILDVKGGSEDRKGFCKLLVPNMLSERLHIIDPEGVPNEEPTTPLPPQDDQGGLEVVMEGGLDG